MPKDVPESPKLSPGEASILSAAVAAGGDCYLILDDESARREAQAQAQDIAFTETFGILTAAKRRKLIPAMKPYLERLFEHGFHVSPELVHSLLAEVGEL